MKPHRAKAVTYLRSLEPDELDAYLAGLDLTDYEAYLVRLRYQHHRPLSAIAASTGYSTRHLQRRYARIYDCMERAYV